MKKLSLIIVSSFFSFVVMADQCAYISKEQAQKAAVEIIKMKSSDTFKTLCEPCGEKKAVKAQVNSVEFRSTGFQNYYEVAVNGKGIDLAYTYVSDLNLAKYIGCEASGVSEEIK